MKDRFMKKTVSLILTMGLVAACFLSGCANNGGAAASSGSAATTIASTPASSTAAFKYAHDPKENPKAMEDIVENPAAVYGFSPNPDSKRLGEFASAAWTDPKEVEKYRQDRIAYHKSLDGMYTMLYKMRDEKKSIEEMARAVSAERNRLRLAAYDNDPEGLAKVKKSNLEKYGHEEGPLADELYKKYGSWELVLQNAFSSNPGMDACLGLYDDYYDLYVELGMIPAK